MPLRFPALLNGWQGTPCEYVNFPSIGCGVKSLDVVVAIGLGPIVFQDALAERVFLDVKDIRPAHKVGGKVKASTTGKQASVIQKFTCGIGLKGVPRIRRFAAPDAREGTRFKTDAA